MKGIQRSSCAKFSKISFIAHERAGPPRIDVQESDRSKMNFKILLFFRNIIEFVEIQC